VRGQYVIARRILGPHEVFVRADSSDRQDLDYPILAARLVDKRVAELPGPFDRFSASRIALTSPSENSPVACKMKPA